MRGIAADRRIRLVCFFLCFFLLFVGVKAAQRAAPRREIWAGLVVEWQVPRRVSFERRIWRYDESEDNPHMQPPEEVSTLLRKSVERIKTATIENRDYFIHLVNRAADIEGVGSVFQRIIERNDQMVIDHLMEIKYGVLFKDFRFHAQFEPTGKKGPDLKVKRDGMSAFVEVRRYRSKEGEHIPEESGPHGTLKQYGTPRKAQLQIEKDLRSKLRQIEPQDGVEHGILAIWSDREYFEDIEFECAVRKISPEAAKKGIRFCMYGSHWVRPNRNFYCVPVSLPETFKGWMEDLKGSVVC